MLGYRLWVLAEPHSSSLMWTRNTAISKIRPESNYAHCLTVHRRRSNRYINKKHAWQAVSLCETLKMTKKGLKHSSTCCFHQIETDLLQQWAMSQKHTWGASCWLFPWGSIKRSSPGINSPQLSRLGSQRFPSQGQATASARRRTVNHFNTLRQQKHEW